MWIRAQETWIRAASATSSWRFFLENGRGSRCKETGTASPRACVAWSASGLFSSRTSGGCGAVKAVKAAANQLRSCSHGTAGSHADS